MVTLRESCSETVVGLDLMLTLSTGRLCWSLRRRLISPTYCKSVATVSLHHIDNGVLQVMCEVMECVSPADFCPHSIIPVTLNPV